MAYPSISKPRTIEKAQEKDAILFSSFCPVLEQVHIFVRLHMVSKSETTNWCGTRLPSKLFGILLADLTLYIPSVQLIFMFYPILGKENETIMIGLDWGAVTGREDIWSDSEFFKQWERGQMCVVDTCGWREEWCYPWLTAKRREFLLKKAELKLWPSSSRFNIRGWSSSLQQGLYLVAGLLWTEKQLVSPESPWLVILSFGNSGAVSPATHNADFFFFFFCS